MPMNKHPLLAIHGIPAPRITRASSGAAPLLSLGTAPAPDVSAAFAGGTATILSSLANAELYGMEQGVWYALDAPEELVRSSPSHTLAGILGLAADDLKARLVEAGLVGRGKSLASLEAALRLHRTAPGALRLGAEKFSYASNKYRHAVAPTRPAGHHRAQRAPAARCTPPPRAPRREHAAPRLRPTRAPRPVQLDLLGRRAAGAGAGRAVR